LSIVVNATSYHLEEHLNGEEAFHMKAELDNPICDSLNITGPIWNGVIEGAERKVE
jgi:hypothetical protein